MTFFNDQQTNLSRRSLLKGLGACAALPLLAGLFPKHALAQAISTALEQFPTLVPAQKGILTGAHWGAFEAIVADGRMIRVQPVADDPAPNDLIDMAPFQVHAKNRIKYPMVRKSWLEHGPERWSPARSSGCRATSVPRPSMPVPTAGRVWACSTTAAPCCTG